MLLNIDTYDLKLLTQRQILTLTLVNRVVEKKKHCDEYKYVNTVKKKKKHYDEYVNTVEKKEAL